MLNWFAVLKRMLKLYGVRSTRELGMALGVPLKFGEDGSVEKEIPWLILEMVVQDKGITWDWLLTGRNAPTGSGATSEPGRATERDEEPLVKNPSQPPSKLTRVKMPRIETRELRRALLNGGSRAKPSARFTPTGADAEEYPASPPLDSAKTETAKASEPSSADIRSQVRMQSEILSRSQPSETAGQDQADSVVQELEGIKSAMEAELRRVEKILREQQGKGSS